MSHAPAACRGGRLRLAALAASLFAASEAGAQTLDGYLELSPSSFETSTRVLGQPEVRTDADILFERLNFTYTQPLWPHLTMRAGGYFERTLSDGTTSGVPFDTTATRLRPFLRLDLLAPSFRAELGAARNETRTRNGAFSTRLMRDTLFSSIGWYPSSTAYVQTFLAHRDDHDATRFATDRITDTVNLDAAVRPTRWSHLQYQGQYETVDDRAGEAETETLAHSVRAGVRNTFWDTRWTIGADYNVDRITVTTQSTRPDAALVRVVPIAGRAAIDDFPERDPLPVDPFGPALIDGNRTAPSGIDLGLPPPGGDTDRRNFGVEFGVPREIRRIHLWVDRDLPPEISSWFVFEIWTSEDNLDWRLQRTVTQAPFGPFDPRFDLSFGSLTARFVKIVTPPLAPTVPFASDHPVIGVTEIETFTETAPGKRVDTAERFSVDSRLLIFDEPTFTYEFNYLWNTATGSPTQTFLVNGLSLIHDFGDIWSVTGRLANERNDEGDLLRDSNVFTASLAATPLPTLRSSVVVGARREVLDNIEHRTASSVIWNASATPYRGLDFTANLGRAWQVEIDGRRTETMLADVGAQIVPHPALILNVTYQDDTRTETGAGRPSVSDPSRAFDVSMTFSPVPSFYAFASRRAENRSTTGRRTLHNYSLSWAPFPYGTLRFSVFYNEYYQSDLNSLTRTGGPALRWNVTSRIYARVSYERTRNDSDVQDFDRDVLYGTLHIGF